MKEHLLHRVLIVVLPLMSAKVTAQKPGRQEEMEGMRYDRNPPPPRNRKMLVAFVWPFALLMFDADFVCRLISRSRPPA